MSREPELLFHKHDISRLVEGHRQQASKEIQTIDANRLLNTPTEDLVKFIESKFHFSLPELDLKNACVDQQEAQVAVHDMWARVDGGDGVRHVTGTIVELIVPFTGDRDFFFVRPMNWDSSPPRAVVESHQIKIQASGRDLSQAQVKASFDGTLKDIQQYLDWQKTTAEQFNQSLAQRARQEIEIRKTKLLKDREVVSGLGYPMKQREVAARTYAAPDVRRKIHPQLPPASTAPYKPEPVLDDAIYKDILATIENMTKVMERSPSAFAQMGEEDLRQHYLVQLNGRFEGAATGETFNHLGKTDILIRVQDRNIFIAECKFWKGEATFLLTINQILGYLSWRDTKAAIILFNRNKDFSTVLARVKEAVDKHPHKKRGPTDEGETRFRYTFGNPSDHSREIILTILAFDVPSPAKA